jgi:hypothetical protein
MPSSSAAVAAVAVAVAEATPEVVAVEPRF